MLTIIAAMGIRPDEVLRVLVTHLACLVGQAPTIALERRAYEALLACLPHVCDRSPRLRPALSLRELHSHLGELVEALDMVAAGEAWWAHARQACADVLADLSAHLDVPLADTIPAPADSQAVEDDDGGAW